MCVCVCSFAHTFVVCCYGANLMCWGGVLKFLSWVMVLFDCEFGMTGPGTVVCDYLSYSFMFLSIATSNMVATALARQVSFLNRWKDFLQLWWENYRRVPFLFFDCEICGVGYYFVLISFSLIFNFAHCIFWQDVIGAG